MNSRAQAAWTFAHNESENGENEEKKSINTQVVIGRQFRSSYTDASTKSRQEFTILVQLRSSSNMQ